MADLETLYRLKVQTLLEKLAFGAEYKIKQRTAAGANVEGETFEPYSPGYEAKRLSSGHAISPVDLMYTGDMLAQMTHEIPSFNPNSEEIFFRTKRAEELAYFHNITGAGPAGTLKRGHVLREFFGLSEAEIEDLFKLAETESAELAESLTEETIVKMLKVVQPGRNTS